MRTELSRQALALLLAFILGGGAGLLYDLLRPPRRQLGPVPAFVLDAVYCLVTGAGLFLLAMSAGDGSLGLWQLTASLAGFLLWLHLLSPVFLPFFTKMFHLLGKGHAYARKSLEKIAEIEKKFFQKFKGCFIVRK